MAKSSKAARKRSVAQPGGYGVGNANHRTRQVEIIHLSDIHFGKDHRYQSRRTAKGDSPPPVGIPNLLQLLEEDLAADTAGSPVIICITGDITTTASFEEFEQAENFIRELSTKSYLGQQQSPRSIFVVPGNHDVFYEGTSVGKRWQSWVEFSNRFYETSHKREDPWSMTTAHTLVDDLGVIVLTLNSCINVQKGNRSNQESAPQSTYRSSNGGLHGSRPVCIIGNSC